MGVVSAIVAAVAKITFASVVKFVAGTILSIGVSRLMAKRALKKANAGGDGGARIQLPPATDNKLPIVYGSAFVSGPITDAKLSTDQKTMWYVVALAEHSDDQGGGGGSYTFDTNNIYYDGKKVNFSGGTAQVASLAVNNQGTTQIDTRVNGKLFIYLFTNGSSSGVNTGGQTAIQILQDSQIPVGQRWTANHTMTNTCFAIVKVIYNTDAGTTSLGALACKISNSLTKPGECIKDYLLNTRYGAAIPLARIDTDSLDDLDTYSDQTITYVPVGGGSATQVRYRINGPLDTANDCLTNLQILVDSCDSWLQYSELTGKWKVVINKPYDTAPNAETLNDLFLVDSSNLVGGITINPVDLNETYNELEVAYPNFNIKDQTDFQVVKLVDYQPNLLSPNEAVNRLNVQLPVVNQAVQAKYLGVRRLLQSREDLVIVFSTDYSGIQVLAGDIIRVTHPIYGWTEKLFRVSNVAEEKYSDGSLGAQLVAFEYNGTIYADNAIEDYVPAFNTGLTDPNIISQPGTPTIANNPVSDGQVKSFKITSYVPDEGSVLYMDFNYGNTSNTEQHELYRTVQAGGGLPFTNSDSGNVVFNNINIDINDLPAGNYYFSTTARNDFSGRLSNSSAIFAWTGANLNANSTPGNVIQPNTLPGNTIIANTVNGNVLIANTVNGNVIEANTVNGNVIIANTVNGNTIIANTVNGNTLIANTVQGNTIIANTASGNVVIANTLSGNTVIANTLNGNSIIANTVNGNVIINQTLGFNQLANNLNVQEIESGYAYVTGYAGGNLVIGPSDITTFGNVLTGNFWGLSKYLDVSYSGNLSDYPYYVGDASTTEGYLANSTSSLNPGEATQFDIYNGDYNWYILETDVINIPTGFNAVIDYNGQLVSNVNATVQICSFLSLTTDVLSVPTQQMLTIELIANRPQKVALKSYVDATTSITDAGIVIRSLTSNANIVAITCDLFLSKAYPLV